MAEPRFQRVTSAAREHYDRAITVLERLVPIAQAINRGVLGYAVATAIAAVVLVSSVLIVEVPSSLWTWALLVLATAVLLLPAGVLVVFFFMLREALELPAKLRAIPDVAPARAGELAALVVEARARERTVSVATLPRDSWRAGRLLLRIRDDVPWAGVLISLVRVPFLLAVGAAFVAGLLEIVLAPPTLLAALLLR